MMEQYRIIMQDVEIYPFESASEQTKYLICFGRRHFEVNSAIVNLIFVLQEAQNLREATILFGEKQKKTYSEAELELLIAKYVDPILSSSASISNSFIVKKEIASAQFISIFSNVLKFLFKKKVLLLLLLIVCICEVFFFFNYFSLLTSYRFNLYTLIELLLLYVISSFIHELGHASACRYFGVKHGGVGFGLYLNLPVFYTDVSNIWKLSRKQRLMVNFAGVYFQLILLIPMFLFVFYMNNTLFKYFIYIVNLNFLITLNPFFKFDGYWIVSDLLGVPNLRKRTIELIGYYYKKIRKIGVKEKPFLFRMEKKRRVFMLVYTLIMNCFFVYYFLYILPLFLYDFAKTFPEYAKKFILELVAGRMPDYQLTQFVLMKLVFFLFTIYLLFRMILSGVKRTKIKTNE